MSSKLPPEKMESLINKALEYTSDYANPVHVRKWIENYVSVQEASKIKHERTLEDRVEFGLRRQFTVNGYPSIGGTDVRALMNEEEGNYDPFSNARAVVLEKLFQSEIEEIPLSNALKMEKGLKYEDDILEMYLERSGYVVDFEATEQFKNFVTQGGHPDYPSLTGSPDLIALNKETGERFIVDAKHKDDASAIDKWVYERGANNMYQDQLLTYEILCDFAGIKIDGLHLAAASISPESSFMERDAAIEEGYIKYATIRLKTEEGRKEKILNVVDKYTKMIMEGVIPTFKSVKKSEIDNELPKNIQEEIRKMEVLQPLKTRFEKMYDEAKTNVANALEHLEADLETGCKAGSYTIKRTKSSLTVNSKGYLHALENKLLENGLDENDLDAIKSENTVEKEGYIRFNAPSGKDPRKAKFDDSKALAEASAYELANALFESTGESASELEGEFSAALMESKDNTPAPF